MLGEGTARRRRVSDPQWSWRYSRWMGIMYGPIPVGGIVVLVAMAAYALTQ